jgi:hypothetical protein
LIVANKSSRGRCDNCHGMLHLDSVTVRMYTKRRQVEFRYRLCTDDQALLESLLEGTASIVQRGMFDHNAKPGEAFVRTF